MNGLGFIVPWVLPILAAMLLIAVALHTVVRRLMLIASGSARLLHYDI